MDKVKKFVSYNGHRFCRDSRSGYYISTQFYPPKSLHRYVWETERGVIPNGFEIHHIDFNKANNAIDNLACITEHEHHQIHAAHPTENQLAYRRNKERRKKFINKAKEWHRSEEGRAWHKRHGLICKANGWKRPSVEVHCLVCGKLFIGDTTSKFCCAAHKAKWRRDNHLDDETRICQNCGHEFQASRFSKTKYCSRKCAGIAWGCRKREGDFSQSDNSYELVCSICGTHFESKRPNGKYCPICKKRKRWANPLHVYGTYEYNGQFYRMQELSKLLGIPAGTLRERYKKYGTFEPHEREKRFKYGDEMLTIKEIMIREGIKYQTAYWRIRVKGNGIEYPKCYLD